MHLALLVTLLLHPVVDEPTELRLATSGTGDAPVTWHLDGEELVTTVDGRAAVIRLDTADRELAASSDSTGPWMALARPERPASDGAAYVRGWSARADAIDDAWGDDGDDGVVPAAALWAMIAASVVALAVPWRRATAAATGAFARLRRGVRMRGADPAGDDPSGAPPKDP